jgi:hypothetical protein
MQMHEAVNYAEKVVSIDWNTVEITDWTDLVIAPIFDIQMANIFGIHVDDNDKEIHQVFKQRLVLFLQMFTSRLP